MTSLLKPAAAAGLLALSGGATLAEYPEKPVSIVVPWPPGDLEDALSRMIAEDFKAEYGVPAAVINKPGGGCGPFALFLLSQMTSQTVWAPGQSFAAQPGFWPRLAVIGMTVLGAMNLCGSWRDRRRDERFTAAGEEVLLWVRSLEFAPFRIQPMK